MKYFYDETIEAYIPTPYKYSGLQEIQRTLHYLIAEVTPCSKNHVVPREIILRKTPYIIYLRGREKFELASCLLNNFPVPEPVEFKRHYDLYTFLHPTPHQTFIQRAFTYPYGHSSSTAADTPARCRKHGVTACYECVTRALDNYIIAERKNL